MFDPVFVPYFSKPESLPLKPTPKNRMTSKVYLRKKVTIPKLIQAQKSEPPSRNEVIVSHPSSQTESKLQSKKSIDQNHPIAIRKGMKECTKCPLYPLSHVVSFKKLSPSHRVFSQVRTIFIFLLLYPRLYLMKIGDKS